MLNLLLGAAVCACGLALGLAIRRGYARRERVLADYCALVAYLDEQIAYRLTPLPQAIATFSAAHPGALATALAAFPSIAPLPALPADQWQTMADALRQLGHSDVAGQAKRLQLVSAQAQRWHADALAALQGKGNLYAKLCAFGGVGLMIVMI